MTGFDQNGGSPICDDLTLCYL